MRPLAFPSLVLAAILGPGCPAGSDPDDAPADDDSAAGGEPVPWHDPLAAGPFAVGVREATVPEEERGIELDLMFWYPAGTATGDRPIYFGEAVGDAEPAAAEAPWPVVVFSHGNQGINFQSVFYTERIASHGYVVVAPNHPYNTFLDYDDEHSVEVAVWRPRDVSRALDRILELGEDPSDSLFERVDPTRAAVTGHSYGGWTTAVAAGWVQHEAFVGSEEEYAALGVTFPADLSDPRFAAGISITPCGPSYSGTEGIDRIDVPMLYFGGDLDDICPLDSEVEPMWSHTPDPSWLAVVEGAGHFGFSNMCDIAPTSSDECAPPYRAPAEIQAVTNALAVDFLGLYLRQDTRYGGVLDQVQQVFDGVTVSR